jgi:hypothetical protein
MSWFSHTCWVAIISLLKLALCSHRWNNKMEPWSLVQARGRKLALCSHKCCDATCSVIFLRPKGHFVRDVLWWCYSQTLWTIYLTIGRMYNLNILGTRMEALIHLFWNRGMTKFINVCVTMVVQWPGRSCRSKPQAGGPKRWLVGPTLAPSQHDHGGYAC